MDQLSEELSVFLTRLHQQPFSISEKVKHFMKHLIYLLPDKEVELITSFYGIFDSPEKTVDVLASQEHITVEQLQERVSHDLRRLAITPEWQMIKQLI